MTDDREKYPQLTWDQHGRPRCGIWLGSPSSNWEGWDDPLIGQPVTVAHDPATGAIDIANALGIRHRVRETTTFRFRVAVVEEVATTEKRTWREHGFPQFGIWMGTGGAEEDPMAGRAVIVSEAKDPGFVRFDSGVGMSVKLPLDVSFRFVPALLVPEGTVLDLCIGRCRKMMPVPVEHVGTAICADCTAAPEETRKASWLDAPYTGKKFRLGPPPGVAAAAEAMASMLSAEELQHLARQVKKRLKRAKKPGELPLLHQVLTVAAEKAELEKSWVRHVYAHPEDAEPAEVVLEDGTRTRTIPPGVSFTVPDADGATVWAAVP